MNKLLLVLFLLPAMLKGQTITTFAGCGTGCTIVGDGGPATSAYINAPNGGAFDRYGNYFFAEPTGQRIRKVSIDGIISTIAGTGSGGFSGDSGLATAARLSSPTAVILDTFGNVYIDDLNNMRIRKVDMTTGLISTICGNGTGAFSGDGHSADSAEIWGVQDICMDKFGNLYLADQVNYRVRKINTSGIITTYAGSGGFSATGTGDNGPATAATFNLIAGLAADDTGNIYVADYNAGKVRKVDTAGIITTIAGNGTITYTGDGIPAVNAQIAPLRLSFDSSKNLFIADKFNHRVFKVDHFGIIHCVAGNGTTGYSGDSVPAISTSIDFPAGVAFDLCGNLYIADVNNRRVRKVIFDTTGIPALFITQNPEGASCAGSPVTYTAAVTAGAAITYNWYVDGSLITGSTSSTYSYVPANGDSIRCVLIGISQCSGAVDTVSSNTIHMVVTPLTTPTITITSGATALVGATVTVTATVAGAGSSYNIKWFNNGVLFNTTSVPSVTYIKGAGTDLITARVIPLSTAGCFDSTTSSVINIVGVNESVTSPLGRPGEVLIYPNPGHTEINVVGENMVDVCVCDVFGRVVTTAYPLSKMGTETLRINIEDLPVGVYVVKVTDSDGQKIVSKVVKE